MLTTRPTIDRQAALAWYRKNRARTKALFDLVSEEAYYSRPISLRHPLVFYEGHLPAFSLNTFLKRALGEPGIDEGLETLFARGIDPDDEQAAQGRGPAQWPRREQVKAFADEADARILDALERAELDRPGHELLDGAEAVYAILEHEAMHQETLLYMWHQLPHTQKHAPVGYHPVTTGPRPEADTVLVPAGRAALGVNRGREPFAWDNEMPAREEDVAAFRVDRHNVTNEEFLAFVDAGGYQQERWWTPENWSWVREEKVTHPPFWVKDGKGWRWRGMFQDLDLPARWPVYVSHAEAAAYARWKGGRLLTEGEYQRAAYGSPSGEPRRFPWGDAPWDATHSVLDFTSWEPQPVATHPQGRSAWGIDDLAGNGWEWTSTIFDGFPGFKALASYPEYSADFFDGQHYVMKGGSPATAKELLRPTFRNWFRPRYPYVYATFRVVREAA